MQRISQRLLPSFPLGVTAAATDRDAAGNEVAPQVVGEAGRGSKQDKEARQGSVWRQQDVQKKKKKGPPSPSARDVSQRKELLLEEARQSSLQEASALPVQLEDFRAIIQSELRLAVNDIDALVQRRFADLQATRPSVKWQDPFREQQGRYSHHTAAGDQDLPAFKPVMTLGTVVKKLKDPAALAAPPRNGEKINGLMALKMKSKVNTWKQDAHEHAEDTALVQRTPASNEEEGTEVQKKAREAGSGRNPSGRNGTTRKLSVRNRLVRTGTKLERSNWITRGSRGVRKAFSDPTGVIKNFFNREGATWTVLVVISAILYGCVVDEMARAKGRLEDENTQWYYVIDGLLGCMFVLELIVRATRQKLDFFLEPDNLFWNLLDIACTAATFVEIALSHGPWPNTWLALRIRPIRLFRIILLFGLIEELHMIYRSLMASFKAFMWTLFFIVIILYCFALWFVQIVNRNEVSPELYAYFCNLPYGMMVLWEAMSGGVDWGDIAMAFVNNQWYGSAFLVCFYVAVMVLALMNVVTGVFVDSVVIYSKQERDDTAFERLSSFVKDLADAETGKVEWTLLEGRLEDPLDPSSKLFKDFGIDTPDIHMLQTLLDANGDGVLEADEFLHGCKHLRGPAKALDLMLVFRETQTLEQELHCSKELHDLELKKE